MILWQGVNNGNDETGIRRRQRAAQDRGDDGGSGKIRVCLIS